MMNLQQSLESTADGAFAVDLNLRIIHWNQAAQDILGYDKGETIGRRCHQILNGLDDNRRLFCTACCAVARSISRREPVANYDILALTKRGRRCWLNISVITYRDQANGGNPFIIHLFRNSAMVKGLESLFNKGLEFGRYDDRIPVMCPAGGIRPQINDLTRREREVLSLMAEGFGTREIAQTLVISRNTARNHIQNILQKLHVHRRTEAVAYAIRNGLAK